MNKLKIYSAVFLFGILCFGIGFNLNTITTYIHRDPQASVNVFVFKETPMGTVIIGQGNLITDIGDRYARDIMGFSNDSEPVWSISLGNASVAAGLTKLTAEATTTGFERAVGLVTALKNGADWAFVVTYKFTATGYIQVDSAGLNWVSTGNSDGNLFAAAALTGGAQSFYNIWNCTVVWTITWKH
jgi:hypothetical protein